MEAELIADECMGWFREEKKRLATCPEEAIVWAHKQGLMSDVEFMICATVYDYEGMRDFNRED